LSKDLPKVPADKDQIGHEATTSVFHVDSLLGGTGVLGHVEVDILKRGALRDLPMNGANVCCLVSARDVNLEIAHTAKEIIGVDVPLLLVANIDIRRDDAQANEARRAENCREVKRLSRRQYLERTVGIEPYITDQLSVVVLDYRTAGQVAAWWEVDDSGVYCAGAAICTTTSTVGDGKVDSRCVY
jgi:hypothetical protein